MNNRLIMGILVITLGILVALIPTIIFPVCTDMIELMNGKTLFMKCHWSAMAEILVAILMVFDGMLFITFRQRETRLALNIMLLLFGLTVLLIPTVVIGMCETVTMACRLGTEPALKIIGIITMVLAIEEVFFQIISIKKEELHTERSVIK